MMTAADTQEYIPRNLMDHMNPYFAKQHHHHHAHSYGHHSHSHNHSRRHHTSETSTSHNVYPTPTPSSCTSGLQTPVPRRSSLAHTDPPPSLSSSSSNSYNTPPATPPLSLPLSQVITPGLVQATSATATATTTEAGSRKEPVAWCTARARIPTPDGSEYFLHIYENSQDKKEHLAFVFGDAIRSRSLDKVQPNETEMDRVKRGAYTGRLRPIPAAVNAIGVDHSLTNTLPLFQEQEQTTALMVETESTTATTVLSTDSISSTMTTTTAARTTATALMGQDQEEDTVMSMATPSSSTPLVRIHSECFTGEIGHSARCDCGEQLDEAIQRMKEEGAGVVVYLRQEGRGIGLGEKIKAYNLQDLGYDTVMANLLLNHGADERTYEVAQGILEDLSLDQIRLLTNNPDKIEQIELDSQIRVVERVPMMPKSWEALEQGVEASEFEVKEGAVENKTVKGKELDRYLKVKVERMRHMIPIPGVL
ncbi:GTP cyclohydrolase II [Linnemannia exigua]|uniref:GTP cyclohydrolase II n=1 Tax=Linnemannia exigua TaxID=604196 RepID=A0AAD4HAM2_9FUNG|nr:GTP cyclohydrolase II [Linnemannia exigua]